MKKKIHWSSILDKSGNTLTEPTEVCDRWKEYIEELYDRENKPSEYKMKMEEEIEVVDGNLGPDILYKDCRQGSSRIEKWEGSRSG